MESYAIRLLDLTKSGLSHLKKSESSLPTCEVADSSRIDAYIDDFLLLYSIS